MWFKQIQILQLNNAANLSSTVIQQNLASLAFRPCLPSMESSMGWVSPLDDESDDAPLTRSINGYTMLCLQIEEKILPATVIRHELTKKIKKIETEEARRVRQSEKLSWKDEIKLTLLSKAFTRFIKIYAYIDARNGHLILGTANAKRAEQFIMLFNKSMNEDISFMEVNKLSPIITNWVKHQNYPSAFSIEKNCMLQDPQQQNRIVRCQQQDLFAASIQTLIKDGYEVKQLALNWQDRIEFVLADDFSLKSIKFQDEITSQANEMEAETAEQQFDADFLIMTDVVTQLITDLLSVFPKKNAELEKDKSSNKIMPVVESELATV